MSGIFNSDRKALNITLDTSLSSKRVIRKKDKLIDWRVAPEQLRVDNGPEFIALPIEEWAEARGITVRFIQKGKPLQNGYVECFNKAFREEVLDRFSFTRLMEGQAFTDAWIWIYNRRTNITSARATVHLLSSGRTAFDATSLRISRSIRKWNGEG